MGLLRRPLTNGLIMDMDQPRAYVEHPEHGLKMIYLEEREDYLKNGWHKPGEKPAEEIEEAQEDKKLEEKSELGSMTKDDMRKFVEENELDVVITGKMSEHTARKKIEKALHDNSVENH